jgi:hypothetical protein
MKPGKLETELGQLRNRLARLEDEMKTMKKTQPPAEIVAPVRSAREHPVTRYLETTARGTDAVNGLKGAVVFGLHLADAANPERHWISHYTYPLPNIMTASATQVARVITALSTEASIEIMRALYGDPVDVRQVSASTGLTASRVYHYLKSLALLGLVEAKDGKQALTNKGRCVAAMLLGFALIVPTLDEKAER